MGFFNNVTMALEHILRGSTNGRPRETTHSPEDIILVVDTSFLKALSNHHLWAYQAILSLESVARSRGTKWEWRAPLGVLAEYNRFLQEGTLEEGTGIPLAHHSIDALLDAPRDMELLFPHYTSQLAEEVWKDSPEGRKQTAIYRAEGAGKADLGVIEFALGIAQSGADVYVASSDFKDVVTPLNRKARFFRKNRWRITPMPQSIIDLQYWRQNGLEDTIRHTLTGTVISELQKIRAVASYPVVIFERGVTSGDAVFDVGVGVAEKRYFVPFKLPEEYNVIRDKHYIVPVIRIKSLQNQRDAKKVIEALKIYNSLRLVVVEEGNPYFPRIVSLPLGNGRSILTPYRTDDDFLNYQTNSEFAKATYVPIAMRGQNK